MGQAPARPSGWARLLTRLRTPGIGFVAGVLNGLLGIGGGIVIVPGMIFLRKVNARVAVSTSLGAVMVLAALALAVHLVVSGFAVSLEGGAAVLLTGAATAQVGGWLLNRLPQRVIIVLFTGLTLLSAVNLLLMAAGVLAPPPTATGVPPFWGYPLVGAIAGLFSGLLGIGGGGIVVLGFSVLFHTPILASLPLALLVNVVNAGSGVIAQWHTGQILWGEVRRLTLAALAGIACGVWVAVVLPADQLRIVFAAFFIFMGLRLLKRAMSG